VNHVKLTLFQELQIKLKLDTPAKPKLPSLLRRDFSLSGQGPDRHTKSALYLRKVRKAGALRDRLLCSLFFFLLINKGRKTPFIKVRLFCVS
jgi:hypothetical protein